MTLRDLTKEENLLKLIKQQRFFGKDPSLTRYTPYEFKEYIQFCCEHKYFIEAYSLTIQHVEDILMCIIKRKHLLKDTDAPKVLEVLNNIELVSDVFYALFIKVNNFRNKLAHQIIKNPNFRKRISNVKSHSHDLSTLIELAEEFFLSWVKQHPHQFPFFKPIDELNKSERIKIKLLENIVGYAVAEEINIPYKGLSSEEWKSKFLEEFKERINQKFLDLFKIKICEET